MGGWLAVTKQSGSATERFHGVADLNRFDDDDFLAYGYWSKATPDSLDGSSFQSFFYGSMPYQGNIATFPPATTTKTVTYMGDAAGVYNVYGTGNDPDQYGHFDADITLDLHLNSGGTQLQGRLSNIQKLSGDPAVTFTSTDIVLDATNQDGELFPGGRFAGTGPNNALWGGVFFGPWSANDNQVPTGVAGWFEKVPHSFEGVLSGSFGAKCTSNNCN